MWLATVEDFAAIDHRVSEGETTPSMLEWADPSRTSFADTWLGTTIEIAMEEVPV